MESGHFIIQHSPTKYISPLIKGAFSLCTPGMGVNLWGESPLYENQKVFI